MSSLVPPPSQPSGLTPKKNLRRSAKEIVSELLERVPFVHVSDLTLVEKNTLLEAYPAAEGSNRLLRQSSTFQDSWIERVLRKLKEGKDPYKN